MLRSLSLDEDGQKAGDVGQSYGLPWSKLPWWEKCMKQTAGHDVLQESGQRRWEMVASRVQWHHAYPTYTDLCGAEVGVRKPFSMSYVNVKAKVKASLQPPTPSSWQQAEWWWATDSFKNDTAHLRFGPNETTFSSVPCLASLETHRHFSTDVKVEGLEVAQLWRLLRWQRTQVWSPASAWRLIPL